MKEKQKYILEMSNPKTYEVERTEAIYTYNADEVFERVNELTSKFLVNVFCGEAAYEQYKLSECI